ncbi:MAG: hypothetical protein DI589_13740 [Shinella sp.]|jgi:hypothetical protein|nr:MAG: hypothetical protein DI589_13740 [Shinella sp.]
MRTAELGCIKPTTQLIRPDLADQFIGAQQILSKVDALLVILWRAMNSPQGSGEISTIELLEAFTVTVALARTEIDACMGRLEEGEMMAMAMVEQNCDDW